MSGIIAKMLNYVIYMSNQKSFLKNPSPCQTVIDTLVRTLEKTILAICLKIKQN